MDNQVEAFAPEAVEEVRPYTVAAVSSGPAKHFITKKGAVAKGDVVLTGTGVLWHVIRLDTKAERVEGTLKGRKLLTESVELPDNCPVEDEAA